MTLMKKSKKTNNLRALPAWLLLLLLAMQSPQLLAASADWDPNPFDGDWNNDSNWTPAAAPNGPNDTATFDASNITDLFLSQDTEVDGIVFNNGASEYTITASPAFAFTLSGVGITNNSGAVQTFVVDVDAFGDAGVINFTNSATAGDMTTFLNNGAAVDGAPGAQTNFFNSSSAGAGFFLTVGGSVSGAGGGNVQFHDNSTAASGEFTNNGAVNGNNGGFVQFLNSSTAASGVFTNNGGMANGANGGATRFNDTSTAENGTFFTNGGTVSGAGGGATDFFNNSDAGSGTFITNGGLVGGAASGFVVFLDSASANNATFTNNGGVANTAGGGQIIFINNSTAGSATFVTNGGTVSGAFGGFIGFNDNSTAANGTFTTNGATVGDANAGGEVRFSQTATAGSGSFTNNPGTAIGAPGAITGAQTNFTDSSSAGTATFINNGGAVSAAGFSPTGVTRFSSNSTASNGTFTSNGGTVSGAGGGATVFQDSATAANGVFTANGGTVNGAGGAFNTFVGSTTAASATLIANGGAGGGAGGSTRIFNDATGGTARVEVFGNGNLDISNHNAPGVTIGSLEGTGIAFLGARNLTIGSNNLSTVFSGTIQDGGVVGGAGGSLSKIGTGTLSLTNSNTFTGGTLINAGTLIASADGALGTGNVSLTASSVTLTLQNGATNNYIANTADLSIVSGSTVNLNFSGNPDAIAALFVNGVAQIPGLYGSATSGAPNQLSQFFGTGQILVTAIPEPSTWAMMLSGLALLLVVQRWIPVAHASRLRSPRARKQEARATKDSPRHLPRGQRAGRPVERQRQCDGRRVKLQRPDSRIQ